MVWAARLPERNSHLCAEILKSNYATRKLKVGLGHSDVASALTLILLIHGLIQFIHAILRKSLNKVVNIRYLHNLRKCYHVVQHCIENM